jgi:cellulose synthase/poly-beta-1,6-N-acetylglucosamine synthase-like glycosyltransferase
MKPQMVRERAPQSSLTLLEPETKPASDALPLVSIVVPCRNEEKHIGRCLESILANDIRRSGWRFWCWTE